MKAKDLQEKLNRFNPESEIMVTKGAEGEPLDIIDINELCNKDVSLVQLVCDNPNSKFIRKALLVQYDVYHPYFNKEWNKKRPNHVDSISDFLESYLPCEKEEAIKIANEVIDEIASLSTREVKLRIKRNECIGAIINRIVGREIIPNVLPPIN